MTLRCRIFGHKLNTVNYTTYVRRDIVEESVDLLSEDNMYTKAEVTEKNAGVSGVLSRE